MIRCKELVEGQDGKIKLYTSTSGANAGNVIGDSIHENPLLYLEGKAASLDISEVEAFSDLLVENSSATSPTIEGFNLKDYLDTINFYTVEANGLTFPQGLYCISPSTDPLLTEGHNQIIAQSGSICVWKYIVYSIVDTTTTRFNVTDIVNLLFLQSRKTFLSEQAACLLIAEVFNNRDIFTHLTDEQRRVGITHGTSTWNTIIRDLFSSYVDSNMSIDSEKFFKDTRKLPYPLINLNNEEAFLTLSLPNSSYPENLKIFYVLRSREQGFIVPNSLTSWTEYTIGTHLGINTSDAIYFDEEHNFVGQIIGVCTTESSPNLSSNYCSLMVSKPISKAPESLYGDNILVNNDPNVADQELLLNVTLETTETFAGIVFN